MTETEWLTATDPTPMLKFLQGKVNDRKMRLLVCGMGRLDQNVRTLNALKAIELGEGLADGVATNEEVFSFSQVTTGERGTGIWLTLVPDLIEAVKLLIETVHSDRTRQFPDLLRDIVGNPFHPVAVDPSWLTSDVLALAAGIYSDRAFDRMPILADALQDAGCDNPDILTHCRGDGPHVRGCWVIDAVLGKA